MKKFFCIVFLLCISSLFFLEQYQEQTIIVYSSMEQFRSDELQKQLDEKFPHLYVRVMYLPTAKAAARLQVEKENADADIVVGLESSYLESIKDHLEIVEGYSQLAFEEGLEVADNENRYVTWERQAGAIIVNTEVLKEKNLPLPNSYEDLLDEAYRSWIAMPDPKSSSTGYFFYKSFVNSMNEENASIYIDTLQKNIKQFTESGSGPIKLLKQKEVAIGLGLTFQAVNEINKGMPFQILYPPQGSPYSITGTAMIHKKNKRKEVEDVFRFIVNDFLVYDKEHFSPEKILKNQKIQIENYPQEIPYADMTGISDIQEKKRLVEQWKY